MVYILNFILGASWAVAIVGALFFIYHFYFLGLLFSGLIGASFGLILALISYLLLRILNSDQVCN